MKKFIKNLLAVALVGAMLGSFGCKDYDEDIKSLNDRLDKVEASVADLQAEIDGGAVITGVSNTADGVVVTLSNGQSFTLKHGTNGTNGINGTDGKDGKDGKDADVWTIGDDGYWYKNGTKTEYKAVGIDGEDGKYYVPGDDGYWDIYQDGQKVEDTQDSWVGQGLTATYTGGVLKLSGVEGAEDDVVTLMNGNQLGSVAFVPNTIATDFGYPTTDEPWLYIPTYKDEAKAAATTWTVEGTTYTYDAYEFVPQNWDRSNILTLIYRANPTNAFVGGSMYDYINRDIKTITRGVKGDQMDLLNVDNNRAPITSTPDGQIDVETTFNISGYNAQADANFAALQVWNNQNPVTSDYIYVRSEKISTIIVNTTGGAPYYTRREAINSNNAEDDEFVKAHVGVVNLGDGLLNDPTRDFMLGTTKQFSEQFRPVQDNHFYFSYNDPAGALELMPCVDLYSPEKKALLTALKFKASDIAFKFSKPADYRANDSDWTNEQDFINVTEDGTVTINTNGKWFVEGGLKAAEGRTPVVRVDAFMKPNKKHLPNPFKDKEDENYSVDGEWELVASAYIKICITEKAPILGFYDVIDPVEVVIGNVGPYDYRELGGIDYAEFWASKHTANLLDENGINVKETISTGEKAWVEVGRMPWDRINRELYGAQGQSSISFWENYGLNQDGTSRNEFYVKIEAKDNSGKYVQIYPVVGDNVNVKTTQRFKYQDKNGNGIKESSELIPGTDEEILLGKIHYTNEVVIIEQDGIFVRVELHDNGETSSFVQVGINNEVKTQHTYGVEKAEYKVTLTIPSEKNTVRGDYELTQYFSVQDCCPDYGYNSYYNQENAPIISVLNKDVAADVADTGVEDTFIVKGHIVDGDWKVQELFSEGFDIVNNEMIFEYWSKWDFQTKSHITNVVNLGYSWVDNHIVSALKENGKAVKHWAGEAAEPSTDYSNMITPNNDQLHNNDDQHLFRDGEFFTEDDYLVMEATMTKNWYIKTMNLTQLLVNGEHCGQTYNVVFYNPFYAVVNKEPIKIYGNTPDYEAVQNRLHKYPTAQMVTIKDIYDDLVLATADADAVFTVLKNNYGVDQGEVVYVEFAWDERYEALKAKDINDAGLQDIEEKLTLDASTGVITWNNNGTALSGNYEVGVVAKIAVKRPQAGLEDLCEFVIPTDIEVILAAERYPIQ